MNNKLFLTGPPRSGKSTAIKTIINTLGHEKFKGFYTEEIRMNDKREGFKIITMDGREGILASIHFESDVRLSRYGLDMNVFEELCISSIKNDSEDKIILIDEVGPMQMYSQKFKTYLETIMKDNSPVLGTIYVDEHPWIDGFKKDHELELIHVNPTNRDDVPKDIISKLGKR